MTDTLEVNLVETVEVVLVVDEYDVSVTYEEVVVELGPVSGPQGQRGPTGAAGSGAVVLDRVAAVSLGGHRVVRPLPDGTVDYATNLEPVSAVVPLWLTLGAATAGDPVQVVAFGEVTEPSWNWVLELPIFLSGNGLLTQVAPTSGLLVPVAATAAEPSSILFQPRAPITLI